MVLPVLFSKIYIIDVLLFADLCYIYNAHFSPDLEIVEIGPAHRFLRSTDNIIIERGWLQFRITWGDNVHIHWAAGQGIYDSAILKQ